MNNAHTTAVAVPSTASRNGIQLDHAALKATAIRMGIKQPVQVKWSQGRRRIGAHRLKGAVHSITVSSLLADAQSVSQVLHHELMHAQQVEREGRENFYPRYKLANQAYGYRRNPYEVEARANEAQAARYPLTKGARSVVDTPVAPEPAGVGTGQRIAVSRKNRNGHRVHVIDGSLDSSYGTTGGRWVVVNVTTGAAKRYSGKREAKAALTSI